MVLTSGLPGLIINSPYQECSEVYVYYYGLLMYINNIQNIM